MIENPTRNDLVELIGKESGTCVSIVMRTHESGRETNQNPIRFKNLISEAIKRVGDSDGKLRERLQGLPSLSTTPSFGSTSRPDSHYSRTVNPINSSS